MVIALGITKAVLLLKATGKVSEKGLPYLTHQKTGNITGIAVRNVAPIKGRISSLSVVTPRRFITVFRVWVPTEVVVSQARIPETDSL